MASPIQVDPLEKEVRFAVVMYGGVSLAIYINGVTQELMSMVRATARSRQGDGTDYHIPEANLSGVEAVYREVGRCLKARFVVDIISGTSAGGINGVFLAKALANDQNIDQLRKLWIEQGDIGVLINDKDSFSELDGLAPLEKPASLLNSKRMYYQLLKALRDMKPKPKAGASSGAAAQARVSPYVDELDLFITATDLQGPPVQLVSSTGLLARERRFRNVFHFHYSTPDAAGREDVDEHGQIVNDFEEKNDPFLAFAARCTSSFPFAFEPMRLKDIDSLLGHGPFKNYSYDPESWAGFYRDYKAEYFPAQCFGDGGYLDNKPFSYATATLSRRRADLPVDRKLIYLEPAPEHIHDMGSDPDNIEPPDAFANVLLALVKLPRYETIREDLQAINDRNKVIQTVNDIVQNIDQIYTLHRGKLEEWKPSDAQQAAPPWRSQYLDEMIQKYGVGYLPYHQLRLRQVLEDLQELFVRRMGWREDCPETRQLESLLRAWQHTYYKTSPAEGNVIPGVERKSENDLLFRLDTGWYIRRLHYLRGLIDALMNDLLENKFGAPGSRSKSILEHSQVDIQVTPANSEDVRLAMLALKRSLNDAYVGLRGKGRGLRSRAATQSAKDRKGRKEFEAALADLQKFWESKRLQDDDAPTRLEELAQLSARQEAHAGLDPDELKTLREGLQRLEDLATTLTRVEGGPICTILKETSDQIHEALKAPPEVHPGSNLTPAMVAASPSLQRCLQFYDAMFEYFDMLTFPITYGTNVGESDVVEIIRISPEDADALVDREKSYTKLAGTKLGNFGAFFNPEWRENDMLWGRLDGAECLIKAVWPPEMDPAECDRLIRKAHQAILEESLLPKAELTAFRARYGFGHVEAKELHQALAHLKADKTNIVENFRQTYMVDSEFPPAPTLKVVSRASSVLGQLMGGLADRYPQLDRPATILTRFGQIFFGLIAAAMPNSLANALFRTLIGSIYVVELLMVFGGRVMVGLDTPNRGIDFTAIGTGIAKLGAQAFVVTLFTHILIALLGRAILRDWRIFKFLPLVGRIVKGVVVVIALLLMFSGLLYLGAFPALSESLSGVREILKQFFGT